MCQRPQPYRKASKNRCRFQRHSGKERRDHLHIWRASHIGIECAGPSTLLPQHNSGIRSKTRQPQSTPRTQRTIDNILPSRGALFKGSCDSRNGMFRAEHSAGSRQWQSAAVGSPLANGFFQPSAIGIRLSATVHIPSLCNLRPVGGRGARCCIRAENKVCLANT